MVRLSKRLAAAVGLITPGSRVADVGCDHAYAAIFLCEQGIAPSVIAMDVRSGPLLRAAEHVGRAGHAYQIELRQSDGLAALTPGEADTILMCGMGGPLMERMLSEAPETVRRARELVLQPQSEAEKLRRFLHRFGCAITAERMVWEDGKFYVMLRAVPSGQVQPYDCQYEYSYGKLLIEAGDEVLARFLQRERALTQGLLSSLGSQTTPKATDRRLELEQKLDCLTRAEEAVRAARKERGNDMRITVNGTEKFYENKTKLSVIAKDVAAEYPHPIILAKVNGKLRELGKWVQDGANVTFLTTATDNGNRAYTRGLILLFLKAMYTVYGKEGIGTVRIQHSIGTGLYGVVEGKPELSAEMLTKVKEEMKRLVAADLPFEKRTVGTADAIETFHKHGMYEKERLFGYRRVSKVNVYSLDGFEDYFYGFMPNSTGILSTFDLFPYEQGFILLVPDKAAPEVLPTFEKRENFFRVLKESNEWSKIMGIQTVGAMNDALSRGKLNEIILVQEAFMEKKLADIAAQIKARGNVKFVMIAGPSSSGKTTFSHRISIQLKTLGFKPHPIGVDDYFCDREDTPKHPDGSYNFETLGAIDVEQFNKDMTALLRGEEVELPTYNFKKGAREYKGNVKKLGPDDILVIEGIHGLNDELSYKLPLESKFKIYISALTQLNVDEHNRIATTDARLLRRIVRDARTRGATAEDTIRMWPSVRQGEEENIFPFQEGADAMFNSALLYELVILKQYAEPLLFCVDKASPEYVEAQRLLKFLDYFLGASSEDVPRNSILREFIGGSCFNV